MKNGKNPSISAVFLTNRAEVPLPANSRRMEMPSNQALINNAFGRVTESISLKILTISNFHSTAFLLFNRQMKKLEDQLPRRVHHFPQSKEQIVLFIDRKRENLMDILHDMVLKQIVRHLPMRDVALPHKHFVCIMLAACRCVHGDKHIVIVAEELDCRGIIDTVIGGYDEICQLLRLILAQTGKESLQLTDVQGIPGFELRLYLNDRLL